MKAEKLAELVSLLTQAIEFCDTEQRIAFESNNPQDSRKWIGRKENFRAARTSVSSTLSDLRCTCVPERIGEAHDMGCLQEGR